MLWSQLISNGATVIAGLGGAALGFRLSERQTRQAEKRTTSRIRLSVRSLVNLEIDENIESFRDYWGNLTGKSYEEITQGEFEANERIQFCIGQMAMQAKPEWRRTMWESQAEWLPVAFDKSELAIAYRVYKAFDRIDLLHETVASTYQIDLEDRRGSGMSVGALDGLNPRLPRLAPIVMPELHKVASQLIEEGNRLN